MEHATIINHKTNYKIIEFSMVDSISKEKYVVT